MWYSKNAETSNKNKKKEDRTHTKYYIVVKKEEKKTSEQQTTRQSRWEILHRIRRNARKIQQRLSINEGKERFLQ